MGLEGSMTTDCSGSNMTREQEVAVYAGHLDFLKETGWTECLSPMGRNRVQSHFYKVRLKLARHEGVEMEDIYKDFPVSVHPHIIKLIKQLNDFEDGLDKETQY